MTYILYNPSHNRSIFNILKYLDYRQFALEPSLTQESLIDSDVVDSPSIYEVDTEKWYIGEHECIKFYSDSTLIMHLKDKSETFNKQYPNYPKQLYKIKIE